MKLAVALTAGIFGGTLMAADAPKERAIELSVSQDGDIVAATLTGKSRIDQRVEYAIEMAGSSTSTHKGSTMLQAEKAAVLSTLRMKTHEGWCVTARIVEQDGTAYEFSEGSCD